MKVMCTNGNPIRVRTAKNMDGSQLQSLGYSNFTPGIRYDISHTKSRYVRLIKAYRYGDAHCDMYFYTADLQPIADIGTLDIRAFCGRALNQMLDKAINLVQSHYDPPSYFDLIPPPYYEDGDDYSDFHLF